MQSLKFKFRIPPKKTNSFFNVSYVVANPQWLILGGLTVLSENSELSLVKA